MVNKEVIELEKVPEGKERITFELRVKLGVNWNYDVVESTFLFFDNESKIPTSLTDGLSTYLKACFNEMSGVVDVDFNMETADIPKECKDSYDKFLKAHTESEKQRVKKEIEELENKAKQLKEKLKKL